MRLTPTACPECGEPIMGELAVDSTGDPFAWTDGKFWWHTCCIDVEEDDVEIYAAFSAQEVDEGALCDTCNRAICEPPVQDAALESILLAAHQHGIDSEPDHEVGDLQDALRIAWDLLDDSGRSTLLQRFRDEVAGPDNSLLEADPEQYVQVKVRLTRDESRRLVEAAKRSGLPDWELIRKAMRAFGLI